MKKKIFLLAVINPLCILLNISYGQAPDWIWAKSAGGNQADIVNCIETDAGGNIYVTGFFESDTVNFGSFKLPNKGVNDIFIAKYDSSGNVLWAKSAGGVDADWGHGIISDDTGNTYITGFFKSDSLAFDNIVLNNPNQSGSQAIFLVKFDPSGNVLWAKTIGGGFGDQQTYK